MLVRNAVASTIEALFAGKERAALVEAMLHRALTAEVPVHGSFQLELDEALTINTDTERVAIEVSPDGTITARPTTERVAKAGRRSPAAA
jgi:hypothetical protein